ncbi:hypothetical protein GCM10009808_08970 [Microbacterium sediminicola]|uniref:SURF1-like protein n=1 Tax=Microbacterium sediminicola TaxID=415210 RepID=A0ABP4TUH5_9MICO
MNTNARTVWRWTGYVAVAIVFAIVCAFLSNWQFSRNAERSAQLALVAANYDAEPGSLADLLPSDDELPVDSEWHPVALTGTYLADETILVRNRPRGGTSAFEVLVPFRTDDGRVLLIDRGWIPPGEDSEPSAVPAVPDGTVTVIARLRPSESLPASGRTDAPDGQVPTIYLPLVAEKVDSDLITGAYGLMVSEDPAPPTAPNALDDPSEDPGPYLSYAIQWILFAAMGFGFIGYVIRTEIRARREDAEDDPDAGYDRDKDSAPPPSAPRSGRKRDRDMDEEDAILDSLSR